MQSYPTALYTRAVVQLCGAVLGTACIHPSNNGILQNGILQYVILSTASNLLTQVLSLTPSNPLLRMQILSNNAVATGVGVYWMFYAGGSFEEVQTPQGVPGLQADTTVEGLR